MGGAYLMHADPGVFPEPPRVLFSNAGSATNNPLSWTVKRISQLLGQQVSEPQTSNLKPRPPFRVPFFGPLRTVQSANQFFMRPPEWFGLCRAAPSYGGLDFRPEGPPNRALGD